MACPKCGETQVVARGLHSYYACGFRSEAKVVKSECGAFKKAEAPGPVLTACTCDLYALMAQGCKCGAFQKELAGKK